MCCLHTAFTLLICRGELLNKASHNCMQSVIPAAGRNMLNKDVLKSAAD
jgi:hypothetical protein